MRRAVLATAVVLLATACSGGGTPPAGEAAADTAGSPAEPGAGTTTTTTTEPPLAAGDRSGPGTLGAIPLFPDELPGALTHLEFDPLSSGYRTGGSDLTAAIDPSDEADDVIGFGLIAEFSTHYGDPSGLRITTEGVAFETADGASGYINDWVEDLRLGAATTEPGVSDLVEFTAEHIGTAADEAIRATYLIEYLGGDRARSIAGGALVVRSGDLVAWAWATGPDPAVVAEALDLLQPPVTGHLLGVASGELGPRPGTGLGLTPAPTVALDSFRFEYAYGVESTDPAAGFSVEVIGEFEAPDLTSCRISITEGNREPVQTYLVVAGALVWMGDLTGYQQVPLRHPAALSALPVCPGHPIFWETTTLHRIPDRPGETAEFGGIPVRRYDLAGDLAALDDLGYFEDEAAQILRYEVARAVDGGWPIEVTIERETDLASARLTFGLPHSGLNPALEATTFTRLRLAHLDDPGITVDVPLLVG